MIQFSAKFKKVSFWAKFSLLPSGGQAKFFFENRALSLFIIYEELTPCQKLENSYDWKYQNSDIDYLTNQPTNQPTNILTPSSTDVEN